MTINAPDAGEAFVLLDDSLSADGEALLFETPVEIVRCDSPADAEAALARLEDLSTAGHHLAGFLSYELGYLFEPRLKDLTDVDDKRRSASEPLIWMGAFKAPQVLDDKALDRFLNPNDSFEITDLEHSITRDDYIAKIGKVRDYIAAGDVYQINYTFKYDFNFTGDCLALYRSLRKKQPVAYGALVHDPTSNASGFDLLSFSPELFLKREGNRVWTRPMKGTAARGLDNGGDAAQAAWLRGDEKSRAENLMIVDLMRNDIGRIAETGSVEVTDLFTVETYRTVLQMTSGITARLRDGVGFREILRNIFPCGSITGAPKVRAMEIIHELEPDARGVYTGAIGMIAPNGDCRFNVAIRSLMIGQEKTSPESAVRKGKMGIGSGIVYDSNPAEEYDECLLKGRFLTDPMEEFELIETLLWQPDRGYHLLAYHLERLANSARYFGFLHDDKRISEALETAVASLPATSHRVRLLLNQNGQVTVTSSAIERPDPSKHLSFVLSERRVDSRDPFFRHKTTRRQLYDGEFAKLTKQLGCDEVLFLNERGEVAEGSRTNVFIEHAGHLITPPLSSGALAGTLRQALLNDPAHNVREAIVTLHDLKNADRIFLGNSVRGLLEAKALATVSPREREIETAQG